MPRKRVLFVLSELGIGGPQKSFLALLDRIDFERLEVFVYVMQPGGPLAPYLNGRAVMLPANPIVEAMTVPSHHTLKALSTLMKNRRFRMAISVMGAIVRHVVTGNVMNQERQLLWQRFAPDMPRIPGKYDLAFGIQGLASYFVVDCVDARVRFHWIRSDTRILRRREDIDAQYYRKMQGALSVSRSSAAIFESIYPFMRNRVKVLHNHLPLHLYDEVGADTSTMFAPEGHLKLLTVCRLDPLKGLDLAIEACELLIRSGIKVKWFVLGDGVLESKVRRTIRSRGLDDHFILLGFQLNTLAFIRLCDVFVHPSRTEGKSNVVDEAKFAGKPIVVTRYETVGDQIVDGVNGLVCDMSAEGVARAIERLVNDPQLAERLSSRCKGQEDAIADVTGFLEELCEEMP